MDVAARVTGKASGECWSIPRWGASLAAPDAKRIVRFLHLGVAGVQKPKWIAQTNNNFICLRWLLWSRGTGLELWTL